MFALSRITIYLEYYECCIEMQPLFVHEKKILVYDVWRNDEYLYEL